MCYWAKRRKSGYAHKTAHVVKVKLSNSNDESDIAGQAATKFPKTYALNIKDKLDMQIIDTPGIGTDIKLFTLFFVYFNI